VRLTVAAPASILVAMVATLHHELLTGSGESPSAWLMMTHGIYGSGGNWRTIARKVIGERPGWGAVLVDLRQHGRSGPGAPPHTVAACAEDLAALIATLAGDGRVVRALCGHSFGGKVALAHRRIATATLRQTWVLDASPSAHEGLPTADDSTVVAVLDLLEQLPARPRRWRSGWR
jgi:esterase